MWTITLDTRSLVAVALAVAGTVALVASPSTSADAADAARRAPRGSHLAQDTNDHVLLRLTDPKDAPKFVRVGGDGTQATAEFEVPEGKRLVVLDADLVAFDFNGAGLYSAFRLRLENKTTDEVAPAFLRPLVPISYASSSSGSNKYFGDSTGLKAGFVVEPGTRILADIVDFRDVESDAAGEFDANDVEVLLRGYLTSGN